MRILLKIQGTGNVIPFDHQHLLVGTIHKWLGKRNSIHDKVALFSFSRIRGGTFLQEGLIFEKGCSFFFSAYNPEIIKTLIGGVQKDPSMFLKLIVNEIIIQDDPDLSSRDLFYPGSPVLIKRRIDNDIKHTTYIEPNASMYLKETLRTKMKHAGFSDENFEIRFNPLNNQASTKLVNYKGIENKANWCPILIQGSPEIKVFAWNVGIGNSTGIGFGSIE